MINGRVGSGSITEYLKAPDFHMGRLVGNKIHKIILTWPRKDTEWIQISIPFLSHLRLWLKSLYIINVFVFTIFWLGKGGTIP